MKWSQDYDEYVQITKWSLISIEVTIVFAEYEKVLIELHIFEKDLWNKNIECSVKINDNNCMNVETTI